MIYITKIEERVKTAFKEFKPKTLADLLIQAIVFFVTGVVGIFAVSVFTLIVVHMIVWIVHFMPPM